MLLEPSSRLGPYEVKTLLGSGGMGEVYRALDTRLGREVALKVIPPREEVGAGAVARFRTEARAASALDHPGILTVYEIGEENGVPFIAMELVDGRPLSDLLAEGPLPEARALGLAAQIAGALAAAHEAGIVHRDLKPANVMVTRGERVKVVDFGVAKLLGEVSRGDATAQTRTGFVMGTSSYMSPEQARGEAVDFRSDQFALGSVLYEMLTGERAFEGGSTPQTLTAVIEAEPAGWKRFVESASAEVVGLLGRCLSKKPAGRWPATRDLAAELSRLAEEPLRVPGGRKGARANGPPGPHSRLLVATAGAALLVLGSVAGYLAGRGAAPPPPTLDPLTHSGADFSPAASPDGRLVAFASRRDGVPRIWVKSLESGAEAPLTEGPDDAPRFSPSGTDILFIRQDEDRNALYRVPLLGGQPRKLLADAVGADWSPDGTAIAFVRWRDEGGRRTSDVGLVSPEGGEARVLAKVDNVSLLYPRFSPDGRRVALTSSAIFGLSGSIHVLDVDRREVAPLVASGETPHLSAAAWLDAGRSIAFGRSGSRTAFVVSANRAEQVFVRDTGTRTDRRVLSLPSFGPVLDVLGPGRLVLESRAVRGNLREVELGSAPGAVTPRWLTRGSATDRQPVFSPSGDTLLFASTRSGSWDVWSLSLASGSLRNLTSHRADDWDPAFLGSTGRILFSSNRDGHFEVYSAEADGTDARPVSADGHDAQNPTATPDGAFVVYASDHPRKQGLWRVRAGGGEATLLVAGRAQLPEVSPDGRFVAYLGSRAGRTLIRVVRLEDGAPAPFEIDAGAERSGSAGIGRSRWLPDGRSIAFVAPAGGGRRALFTQEFRPGKDTLASRRPLPAGDGTDDLETFGLSPDGRRLAVEALEVSSNLLVADGVAGVAPQRRRGPGR